MTDANDYERGYLDGLNAYAWWKDGTLYVGTTGTTFREASDRFLAESHVSPESDAVLGSCAHGVDLDRAFCPQGCRV